MEKISLTDFIDVVSKSGESKATKVASIKNRGVYSPAVDFYKRLRDGIVELLSSDGPKTSLDDIVTSVHPKRKGHYQEAILGLKKWWGRKELKWFEPCRGEFGEGFVRVSVNPELGVLINDVPHYVKLYFKSDKLPKNYASIASYMMGDCLSGMAPDGTAMAVLDVKHSNLIIGDGGNERIGAALKGELAYIEALWRAI
jgi:hypothetical protein